jgi:aspartyl-tRNA(Asn)/glutamyl-tRNA(Gln) amidotransferase subunit B
MAAPDRYETVIGLECHVELSTETKMFCGCRNVFGAPPNTNVCPVCLGHPGSLPVPNARAIESIIEIGLALDCDIAPQSTFHRKNYFYPDMPKNYQISQYDLPICVGGHLDVATAEGTRRIGITRVHMEEDTGKTTHAGTTGRIAGSEYALVDYNRAGVPLVEVVSEPDLRSPVEAAAYLRELRSTIEALGVSDVRMEEGSLRCDANVSVRARQATELGVKVEIKNMNSVRSLERAIRFEEGRQRAALARGESIVQETRHWSEDAGETTSMRSKEEAFDYRYFPEPDLPPLEPDRAWIDRLRSELPELPAARRSRYESTLDLRSETARVLAASPQLADFFDAVVDLGAGPVAAANQVTQDLAALLNRSRTDVAHGRVRPSHVADIVRLLGDGAISSAAAKAALEVAFETGEDIDAIVDSRGLRQVSDVDELGAIVDAVLEENPDPAAKVRAGNDGVLGFLVGQVMKRSSGSANPQLARDLLQRRLSG